MDTAVDEVTEEALELVTVRPVECLNSRRRDLAVPTLLRAS
jgi:hypothetical protein